MEGYQLFKRILAGSKEFSFSGSVLTLRSYRTGETVKIDLANIDEDVFQELIPDEEDEEY